MKLLKNIIVFIFLLLFMIGYIIIIHVLGFIETQFKSKLK